MRNIFKEAYWDSNNILTQLSQVELRSKERGARSKRIPCSYIQKWQTSEQNIPLAPRSLPLAPQKLSLRNLNILITSFLILISGSPFFSQYKYIYVVSTLVMFLFLAYKKRLNRIKVVKYYMLFFIVQFILQFVAFGWNTIPGIINLIARIFISSSIILLLGSKFKYYYLWSMFIFALIALILYPFKLAGIFIDIFDVPNHHNMLIFDSNVNEPIRNNGPFWEPGAFAGYLVLALAMFINEVDFLLKHKFILIVITIALLTTMSTMGYVVFAFIVFIYLILHLQTFWKYIFIPILFFVAMYVYQKEEFLQKKISEQNEESITSYADAEFSANRLGSLLFDLHYIQKHPIIGNGLHEKTRYEDHPYLISMWNDGTLAHSGNGFSDYMAKFGVPFYIIFFYFFYKNNRNVKKIYLVCFAVSLVLLLQGEMFFNYPLFIAFPFLKLCKKRSISTHPKRGYPFTFLTRSS